MITGKRFSMTVEMEKEETSLLLLMKQKWELLDMTGWIDEKALLNWISGSKKINIVGEDMEPTL